MDDPRYVRYMSWQNSNIPLKRQPKLFKLVSSKAQRLFKRYLEPKPEKRPSSLAEVYRYLEDRWMSKGMEKTANQALQEDEGLCPSLYSFHSSPEEKNKLLFTLTQYGLETTVDRTAKKDRIREWIQNSVIEEEDDQELNEGNSSQDIRSFDIEIDSVDEDNKRYGPITEKRVKKVVSPEMSRREKRLAALKKSTTSYKPPVDPRIPFDHQRNSEKQDIYKRRSSNGNIEYQHNSVMHVGDAGNLRNRSGLDLAQSQLGRYDVASALPFQNMKISNSLNSSESTFSSDSSSTIKHNINIQLPQTKTISRNGFIR